jgi:rhodanese-related sulfurtransferase
MPMRAALLLWAILAAVAAPAQLVSDPAYADRLKNLLDDETPALTVQQCANLPNALYLDAREHEEYAVSHLPGARWVGYEDFSLSRMNGIPKDAPIVVYCSVGYRSGKITEQLREAGYRNTRNLYGGIFEWVNAGKAVVDAQGPTQRVHAYNTDWGRWLRKGEKTY